VTPLRPSSSRRLAIWSVDDRCGVGAGNLLRVMSGSPLRATPGNLLRVTPAIFCA
jgi:hypothetical protein